MRSYAKSVRFYLCNWAPYLALFTSTLFVYYTLTPYVILIYWKQQAHGEVQQLEVLYQKHLPNSTLYKCDIECSKLRKLFNTNWPQNKPKAVIYYLLKTEDIPNLQKAIKLMDTNFNLRHSYPYVIFHEEDFLSKRSEVRHFAHNPEHVFFKQVDFTRLPDHISLDMYRDARNGPFCNRFTLGKNFTFLGAQECTSHWGTKV